MTTSHQCPECEGTGRHRRHGYQDKCWSCRGTGDTFEFCQLGTKGPWNADRCLSNNDNESDPVCVSNIRVFKEMHADSKGTLWRMKHGGYGSTWIEFRAGLAALLVDDSKRAKMEIIARRFDLPQVLSIIETMEALDSYPVLDDDDNSQAEQEEQEEHWESYGRNDFERLLMNRADEIGAEGFDRNGKEIDAVYWRALESVKPYAVYPERIDSSMWNFHTEAPREYQWGGRSEVWELVQSGELDHEIIALSECPTAQTFKAFLSEQSDESGERMVWTDYGVSAGLL